MRGRQFDLRLTAITSLLLDSSSLSSYFEPSLISSSSVRISSPTSTMCEGFQVHPRPRPRPRPGLRSAPPRTISPMHSCCSPSFSEDVFDYDSSSLGTSEREVHECDGCTRFSAAALRGSQPAFPHPTLSRQRSSLPLQHYKRPNHQPHHVPDNYGRGRAGYEDASGSYRPALALLRGRLGCRHPHCARYAPDPCAYVLRLVREIAASAPKVAIHHASL
jgi:hypothetical protein